MKTASVMRTALVTFGFLIVAAFFLTTEHRAHLFGLLPYLLLLACPLLLSGWRGRHYPQLDLMSHDAGHLWNTLIGWKGDPHLDPLHILSTLLIAGGFILLAAAWHVLYEAQRAGRLATTGAYAYARHEERDARRAFGAEYDRYAAVTPAFFPRLGRRQALPPTFSGVSR